MKITLSLKAKQMASALLTVVVLGGIICIFIIYYLSLVEQQNKLGTRSQGWNLAIAVSEAGIEEALEELNTYCIVGSPLASDGWTPNGSVYCRSNTISANGDAYVVSLDLTTRSTPVITSRSYINLPALASAPASYFFATVGSGAGVSQIVSRAIRVTCSQPKNLFMASMIAKHAITLKGNGVLSDSFDSSNPAKSTGGKYDSRLYAGDRGDVATDDSIIVGVGNANIYGKLHTGPTGGYNLGPNGGVGTHAWQAANGGGMEGGYFLQDANFTFPDTRLPDTSSYLTPQPGDLLVTQYAYTSNATTAATLPNPLPWGAITTNIISYVTNTTPPNPTPPGLFTLTTAHSSITLPSPPLPPNIVTNTTSSTSSSYPAAGTYVGSVTTNWNGGGNKIRDYTYDAISGYDWNTYTYVYPNCTYTYYSYQTNSIVVTNHYDNVLYQDHSYVTSALNGSTAITGPNVNLVLPNGLTGAENLYFNYPNDSYEAGLTIWAGGTSASISGNQYINPSGFAGSLLIYCAPSVTSFTLNGNGQFTGVLVAPNADLTMNGGGNSNEDFCGSLMVNSVTLNGHFGFHWDEALSRLAGNNTRYLINSWNEIP
jgi:Putative Ice-binding-like adhesive domain